MGPSTQRSDAAARVFPRQRGISATMPIKVDQAENRRRQGSKGGRPLADYPLSTSRWPEIYRQRHAVECGINRIGRHHGAATWYVILAVRSLAARYHTPPHATTRHIVAISEWL